MLALILIETLEKKADYKPYLYMGLMAKLLSSLAFCLIYQFYYNGGDTISYYNDSQILFHTLLENWELGRTIMQSNPGVFESLTFEFYDQMRYEVEPATFGVVKVAVFLSFLTFGNFYALSMLFAFISFSGLWALYKVLIDLYPKLKFQMALAVFFTPSMLFWGSGILKDTITIGSLGWVVYGFYHLFIKKDQLLIPILALAIGSYAILVIKFYILAAMLPSLLIWFVGHHWAIIKDGYLKSMIIIVVGSIMAIFGWFFQDLIINTANEVFYAFIKEAYGFQTWHSYLTEKAGASGYDLGEVDLNNINSIISKIPGAINVSLFRPYLYEVRNIVMLITSVESTIFLLMTVYAFIKIGIFRSLRLLLSKRILIVFMLFVFLLAFIVGFTSYNFGALARYKIPILPFFVASLFILLEEGKQLKTR